MTAARGIAAVANTGLFLEVINGVYQCQAPLSEAQRKKEGTSWPH